MGLHRLPRSFDKRFMEEPNLAGDKTINIPDNQSSDRNYLLKKPAVLYLQKNKLLRHDYIRIAVVRTA